MGTDLPLLPFAAEEENKLFAECVLRNDFPPMDDDEQAAIAWCQFVDGVNIFPKLPVHIRLHRESFERNQRVKNCMMKARAGQDLLNELNEALQPSATSNERPIPNPDPLPIIEKQAMHNSPYVTTGGTAVGNIPSPTRKRKQGDRGKDKKPRRCGCGRCKDFGGKEYEHRYTCEGRLSKREKCEFFGHDGTRRCRRCEEFGEGLLNPLDCAAARGGPDNCEHLGELGNNRSMM